MFKRCGNRTFEGFVKHGVEDATEYTFGDNLTAHSYTCFFFCRFFCRSVRAGCVANKSVKSKKYKSPEHRNSSGSEPTSSLTWGEL